MATALTVAQIGVWCFAPSRTPLSIIAWIIFVVVMAGMTDWGQSCVQSTDSIAPVVLIGVWTLCVEVDVNFLYSTSTEE